MPVEHPVTLQRLDHLPPGEMLRALKCHVLQEVRHATLLVPLFQQEARVSHQVKVRLIPGAVVVTDIIRHTVRQTPHDHLRVTG